MKNWPKFKLGELCKMNSGGTPRRGVDGYYNGDIPWAKISDIENACKGEVLKTEENITKEGLKSIGNKIFPIGTLLLAMYGSVGKTAFAGVELSTNQAILGIKVIDTSVLNPRYLKYWIDSIKDKLVYRAVGGTLQNISLGIVKELEIPLPPLPIQQQIADTLDKADALRRKDQELLDKYEELAQAVFYEMFGDISINSKNWNIVQIRSIAQEVKYGTSSPAADSGNYPYLRMNNISYTGELLLDDLKYISASEKEYEKYGTRYGDLLFNRTNSKDLVGKTTIVDIENPMIIAGYLIRVRLNDQANPWYVSTFMNSTHMKKVLRNKCKSIIGMANINAQELQDFDIPLPPKELQDLFADKLTFIKEQQSLVKKTQSKSSAYFNQCLNNYFV
ncbi:MAG: restriction endonuclease subunit S [Chitinophagaceae bacterium]|nr:restriction endonuclease subunit S [Chitinophagaceae bacterium]